MPLAAEEIADQQDLWTYAAATSALLHDVGKPIADLVVIFVLCADGKPQRWQPLTALLPAGAHYRFRFDPQRRYRRHALIPPLLAHRVIPPAGLDWLASEPTVFDAWLATLSGDDTAGPLATIAHEADGLSVARDLTGGARTRSPGASGFISDDSLWLVSKRVLEELREHLTKEGQTGIPSRNDRLVEDYIAERILRPATQVDYRKIVRIWIRDTKRTIVSKINAKHVREWRATILTRASATSWDSYRRHLRALWNYAMRRNICRVNPFSDTTPAPTPCRRKKTISSTDLNRAANTLQVGDFCRVQPAWFWALAIKTFYYTGMRRRQLTELIWNDIQLNDQSILLRSTSSKTYKEWTIPIFDTLVQDLENFHLVTTTLLDRPPRGDEQVFNVTRFSSRYVGQQMTVDQVSAAFQRLSKAIGVRITPHRLRHTLATAAAPKDTRALQELLGPSNINTTMQYVHPDLERLRSLLDGIDC